MKEFTAKEVKSIEGEIGKFSINDDWNHYGLTVLETDDGKEYALAADDTAADSAAGLYIKDTVWAFNSDFIIEHSSVLDFDNSSEVIVSAIRELCESGNDAMARLIDDMDEFIEDAISADGRGHFLSGYDGEELELENGMLLYRLN